MQSWASKFVIFAVTAAHQRRLPAVTSEIPIADYCIFLKTKVYMYVVMYLFFSDFQGE